MKRKRRQGGRGSIQGVWDWNQTARPDIVMDEGSPTVLGI